METNNTIINTTEELIENEVIDSQEVFDKQKLVKGSIIALGVGTVVTGLVIAYKNRGKIKNYFTKKKIKNLEAKGYLVMKDPSDELYEDVEDVEVNPEKE